MRINCIIDTCSFIYLSKSEFNQNNLIRYLSKKAKINYSKEISKELRDHKDKGLPPFIFDKMNCKRTIKYHIDEYENRMLGKKLPSRQAKGDKGEIDNFILSVDQVHHFKQNAVIFISDDKKALNGILFDWLNAFPAITVWTSYEVILYLYAENIIPSKDIAIEKIQDIITLTAPPSKERNHKTTQSLISLKRDYSNRLNKISSLLK